MRIVTWAIRLIVFALCGLLAGLGGLILAGNLASADPNLGMGYELDVIAAVILGSALIIAAAIHG